MKLFTEGKVMAALKRADHLYATVRKPRYDQEVSVIFASESFVLSIPLNLIRMYRRLNEYADQIIDFQKKIDDKYMVSFKDFGRKGEEIGVGPLFSKLQNSTPITARQVCVSPVYTHLKCLEGDEDVYLVYRHEDNAMIGYLKTYVDIIPYQMAIIDGKVDTTKNAVLSYEDQFGIKLYLMPQAVNAEFSSFLVSQKEMEKRKEIYKKTQPACV